MNPPGIVIIGRNEGERLRRCLDSVLGCGAVVYVDSGSTDDSVAMARSKGVEVVELDLSRPFTAARARNEGFARLEAIDPGVRLVQFVDGDCEVAAGWLDQAVRVLEAHPELGVVCGRRRERFPDRTAYNRLADIEWDTPIGEAKYCGGDAMIRADAFRQVGAYDPALIAGEDPDLCVRLRRAGWSILRIDAEMTRHDIAMTRFGQWWRRSVRAGYAYAEGAARHGASPERHWVHELRHVAIWGIALPLAVVGLAVVGLVGPTGGRGAAPVLAAALAAAYPLKVARIALRRQRAGLRRGDAWLYGAACVLGHFAHAVGATRYWSGRVLGQSRTLIEYKGNTRPPVPLDQEA
jgi:GT2 family glycosyltransferase